MSREWARASYFKYCQPFALDLPGQSPLAGSGAVGPSLPSVGNHHSTVENYFEIVRYNDVRVRDLSRSEACRR